MKADVSPSLVLVLTLNLKKKKKSYLIYSPQSLHYLSSRWRYASLISELQSGIVVDTTGSLFDLSNIIITDKK